MNGACIKIWEQRTDQEPPTECLVEMLTLVLKNNNFTFEGNHYLQINGTVIGTKMAPSYANIFMGNIEERSNDGVNLLVFAWRFQQWSIFALL
jgi:hypothetical protein